MRGETLSTVTNLPWDEGGYAANAHEPDAVGVEVKTR